MDGSVSLAQVQAQRIIQTALDFESKSQTPLDATRLLSLSTDSLPSCTTTIFALAFTVSIVQICLAGFDVVKGITTLIRRSKIRQKVRKANVELPWRPFVSMCVMVAGVLQACHLIYYLLYAENSGSHQLSRHLESAAFASFVFTFLLVLLFKSALRPVDASCKNNRALALQIVCVALASASVIVTVVLLFAGAIQLTSKSNKVDAVLTHLIKSHPVDCESDSSRCGTDTIAMVLQASVDSNRQLTIFKSIILTFLGACIMVSTWELIFSARVCALDASTRSTAEPGSANLTSFTVSDYRRRKVAPIASTNYVKQASIQQPLSIVLPICSSSLKNCYRSHPSTLELGLSLPSPTISLYSDSDRADSIEGVELDTSSQEGRELQRRYGSRDTYSAPSYLNKHFSQQTDKKSLNNLSRAPSFRSTSTFSVDYPGKTTALWDDRFDLDSGYSEKRGSFCSVSSSIQNYESTSHSEHIWSQFTKDRATIRWDCAVYLAVVFLYVATLSLRLIVGDSLDFGDRPSLSLFLVGWTSLLSNSLLGILAILMCRGNGSVVMPVANRSIA